MIAYYQQLNHYLRIYCTLCRQYPLQGQISTHKLRFFLRPTLKIESLQIVYHIGAERRKNNS